MDTNQSSIEKETDKETYSLSSVDRTNKGDIASKIFVIRGIQVMLDTDIAELYEVDVKRLNQQMKRNPKRFPTDFCFRLTEQEVLQLSRLQIVTSMQTAG